MNMSAYAGRAPAPHTEGFRFSPASPRRSMAVNVDNADVHELRERKLPVFTMPESAWLCRSCPSSLPYSAHVYSMSWFL